MSGKTVSIHVTAPCGAAVVAALGLGGLALRGPEAPRLPAGVDLEVHARGLEHARGMTLTEDGTLLVGSTRAGLAYEISPASPDTPPLVARVAPELRDAVPGTGTAPTANGELATLQFEWSPATSELRPVTGAVVHAPAAALPPRALDALADRWAREGSPWGRDVDLVVSPDGATLFVAHRRAGVVYRLRGPEPRVIRTIS